MYALNIVDGDVTISDGDYMDMLNIHICDKLIMIIIQIWFYVC